MLVENNNETPIVKKKSVRISDDSITQKSCPIGKNVEFEKNDLPLFAYLESEQKLNSLGCKEQYPSYNDETNKYCCSKAKPEKEEVLNYVNVLINKAMDNTSAGAFIKSKDVIDYLVKSRKKLTNETYPDFDSWYKEIYSEAQALKKDTSNPAIDYKITVGTDPSEYNISGNGGKRRLTRRGKRTRRHTNKRKQRKKNTKKKLSRKFKKGREEEE